MAESPKVFYEEENPQGITRAELLVAVPSFNEASTIAQTVERLDQGVREFYGDLDSVIVNCDNHSADGTRAAFLSSPTQVPKIYLSTEPGVRGKGANLRMLFHKAKELQAKAVVVFEADITNLAPYWIKYMAEPVLRGAGYVAPIYVRHKFEDTLNTAIVYPLTRCLYGRRVRQLNAGDCAFRGDLVDVFLNPPVWTAAMDQFGVDVCMGTLALTARVPVCQSVIGSPKRHRANDPFAQITLRFRQTLATIFDLMVAYADFWRIVRWSKPTALFSMDGHDTEVAPLVEINMGRLHARFLQGFEEYQPVWREIFEPALFNKVQEIRSLELPHFSFPSHTWALVLFSAALAYRNRDEAERTRVIDSILPLYLGKVVSYANRTERISIQQAEEHVEETCTIFEENKSYLVERWR